VIILGYLLVGVFSARLAYIIDDKYFENCMDPEEDGWIPLFAIMIAWPVAALIGIGMALLAWISRPTNRQKREINKEKKKEKEELEAYKLAKKHDLPY
jgi:hypothetical protein